jgi:hypothetical protein
LFVFIDFLVVPIYIHYNKKCHKFSNFLKLLWMLKISNEKTKHVLYKNAINKN